ncbi:MAG: hypothetical protein QMA99_02750 [Flavobacterium sp.]
MKKINMIVAVIGMILISSCEGPAGPPGFDGQDGFDGQEGLIAEVFEETIEFNSSNDYKVTFPLNPKIYSGDNLLVYQLVNENGGIDTWALLPQIYYFEGGTAQYNYNFSFDQFSILLDASFPLNQLPTSFTLNKTFRIVIVPGDDGINSGGPNSKTSNNKIDYSDYNGVLKKYNIDDRNVRKLNNDFNMR